MNFSLYAAAGAATSSASLTQQKRQNQSEASHSVSQPITNISNVAACALRVIEGELRGVAALKESVISEGFERTVHAVLACKGRLIACGVGKSGHIARKIAATLASTGTPSLFVHPAEASHGDMGMISAQDMVLLLSNSGETRELEDVIAYCKRFSIPIIGVVRRRGSMLAAVADYPFVLPEEPEVTSVNAPTTSTTMMLVWGDALAAALIEARGFDKEDFGVLHPGGKLGGALKKVHAVMSSGDRCASVSPSTPMGDVILVMTRKGHGCSAVVDDKHRILGLITERTLEEHMSGGLLSKKAEDVMERTFVTVSPERLAADAAEIMERQGTGALPVSTDGQRLEGMVYLSMLRALGITS